MKISLVGHAAILIEVGGITILSDPWWRGPCFGAQWWNYPAPDLKVLDDKRIDFIYISHGHHDHFHPGTLGSLDKGARVLVSRSTDLTTAVGALGFGVIEMNDNDPVPLGDRGVLCRVIATHGADTLMAVSDGEQVCVNVNDSLHSAPAAVQVEFVSRLRALYPKIDYVFCGFGTASHFPNCYVIPGKDRIATATHRQNYFNRQWARLIEGLNPVYGFPFAADVALLEADLLWANEPVHNGERPTAAHRALYPDSKVQTIDIAPGFVIEDRSIVRDVRRGPLVDAELRTASAEQIKRANNYGTVDDSAVEEVLVLLRDNLSLCEDYLRSCTLDYMCLIQFRNSELGICVQKTGASIKLSAVSDARAGTGAYNVVYKVRLQYLKWSLTRPFGDEIMFVGSGGIFEYRDRSDTRHNLHRELIVLMKKQKSAPRSRYGVNSRIVFKVKQLIKRLIGKTGEDLYDLDRWTIYRD